MDTTQTFAVDLIGEDSGRRLNGTFRVKTLITRRDRFRADEYRRAALGTLPEAAAANTQGEAYMFGQLMVRIVDAPKWWTDSDNGLDLEDANIIGTVFKLAMDKEKERIQKTKDEADAARKDLADKK